MKRGHNDIVIDILTIILDYSKPTQIMYHANIDWKLLQEILFELIGKEFVDVTYYGIKSKKYYLTEKGRTFLVDYAKLQALLKEDIHTPFFEKNLATLHNVS